MTKEIKIGDVSLLLGMSYGLSHSMLGWIKDKEAKEYFQLKFDEIESMINKIYYQDYKNE